MVYTSSQQSKHSGNIGQLPLLHQPNSRKLRQSFYPVDLDRDAVPIRMFLKCLRSPSMALHDEVLKTLTIVFEHGQRVSNMDGFIESIQKDLIPW